jgi:uncharacterized membrane protein YoaT (DUF817 family)
LLPKHLIYQPTGTFQVYFTELLAFTWHNAISCTFPVLIFITLAFSNIFHVPGLPRYDFILVVCILIQAGMYFSKMETRDELLVITLFHILGLIMEIFKVQKGSWIYPEDAYTKLMRVPIYSGFMYASVASYICQAWRRLDLKFIQWPNQWLVIILGAAIYLNFFTHHYIVDLRWVITACIFVLFYKTWVGFTNNGPQRKIPIVLAFFLIGMFIWFAENIATFLGAWQYTYQHKEWRMVGIGKLSSWGLLVIVSIIIVAELKFLKEGLYKNQGK